PLPAAAMSLDRALALEQQGAVNEAAELGQRIVPILDRCAAADGPDRELARHHRARLHLLLIRCCLRLQQPGLARQWGGRMRQLARDDGAPRFEVKTLLALAGIDEPGADLSREFSELSEARTIAESDGDPWLMAEVALAHGRALLAQARAHTDALAQRTGLNLRALQRLQQPAAQPGDASAPARHRCQRAPGTAGHSDSDLPFEGMTFDPALLAEQVVLNEQIKKDLLYFDAHLDAWSHFELLAISLDASTDDVRKAYFMASKRFHPDRYFRKNTGSYQERIGRVFEAIKTAYGVLCDDAARAEYEATLDWPQPAGLEDELAANRELRQRASDRLRTALKCGRLGGCRDIVAAATAALAETGIAPAPRSALAGARERADGHSRSPPSGSVAASGSLLLTKPMSAGS
ncbi:MAG: DnaJ domain-containing protein, partial [Deltaproteobacteria bacterium]|nr:DnaJ domain-containing protein [Deltaproteobacteria bacterium]